MSVKLVLVMTVLCAVIATIQSERGYDARPYQGYVKRGKYPPRYYNRPVYPVRAPYSYTPPMNYVVDDYAPQYTAKPRPPKVTSPSKPSSSYTVPSSSYTVPSSPSYSAPPAYGTKVIIEAAPPPSAAKVQSDAHLKAIRIWSHKSKGTAYTLHDDGTLSLDKTGRLKSYGYGYGQ